MMNKIGFEALIPFTFKDIDFMLNEAEKDFETGNYLTNDEVFKE